MSKTVQLLLEQKFDEAEQASGCSLKDLLRNKYALENGTTLSLAQYLVRFASAGCIRAFRAKVGSAPFKVRALDDTGGYPIWQAIGRDVEVFKAVLEAMHDCTRHAIIKTACKCVAENYAPGLDALADFLARAYSDSPNRRTDWRVPLLVDTASQEVCLPLQRALVEQVRASNPRRLQWLASGMIMNNCLPLLDAIGHVSNPRPEDFKMLLLNAAGLDWPVTTTIRALIMRYGFWETNITEPFTSIIHETATRGRAIMRVVRETKNVVLVLTLKCCNKRKRLFLPEELTEYIFLEFFE